MHTRSCTYAAVMAEHMPQALKWQSRSSNTQFEHQNGPAVVLPVEIAEGRTHEHRTVDSQIRKLNPEIPAACTRVWTAYRRWELRRGRFGRVWIGNQVQKVAE